MTADGMSSGTARGPPGSMSAACVAVGNSNLQKPALSPCIGGIMKRIGQPLFLVTALALGLLLPNMQTALAAPPSNDALPQAIEIRQVPFVHREDTSEATASGPRFCGNNSSVFFAFTPTEDASLQADTFGSRYDTVLSVFTGTRSTVSGVGCSDDAIGLLSAVRFEAHAGTTYYFEISTCCGHGQDNTGGHLEFALTNVPIVGLEATATVGDVILHPGRVVQLTGTVSCNSRSAVEVYGVMRQLNGDFVARAFFDRYPPVTCQPGRTRRWSVYADTETSVAFDEGTASVRRFVVASNGFDFISSPGVRTTVHIVRP